MFQPRLARIVPIVRLALCSAVFVGVANSAHAATRYVRKTGNDSNSGATPSQAWATLSKAATTLVAGDIVHVGAGAYNEQLAPANAGTSTSPISYIADTSGAMTGDAGSVDVRNSAGIALRVAQAYIQVIGFRFYNSGRGAVWTSGAGGLLQNCQIDGHSSNGMELTGSTVQVTVDSCLVQSNRGIGIQLGVGASITIRDTTSQGNGFIGITCGTNAATNITIERCRVFANGNDGVRINQGTLTLKNCLIYGNGREGFRLDGSSTSKTVAAWNCTIDNNVRYGVYQQQGTLTLTNSIVSNNQSYGLGYNNGALTHTYNLFHNNTPGAYQGTAAGAGEISGDPAFLDQPANDYHLTSVSRAINAGTSASGIVDDDLDSAPRPVEAAWDMGCYEFQDSTGSDNGVRRILSWVELP